MLAVLRDLFMGIKTMPHRGRHCFYLLLYVDDIVFDTASSSDLLQQKLSLPLMQRFCPLCMTPERPHLYLSYSQRGSYGAEADIVVLPMRLMKLAGVYAMRSVENKSDPCGGRYIYIHNLPPRFNEDLVKQCGSRKKWFDLCEFVINNGLGPVLDNTEGVFSNNELETLKDAFDLSVEAIINKVTKLRQDMIDGRANDDFIDELRWKLELLKEGE
ncbi:xyloglucan galactosyltransferase MUR3 [Tanacetum coccineum]